MDENQTYSNPLSSRYASREMGFLFSPQFKYATWRRLWIALAKAQKMLGLPITDKQIAQMQEQLEKIDFAKAAEIEKSVHHDVMAHIHLFGKQCPEAKEIIHLGATSSFVTDNGDLIQMKEALLLLRAKCLQCLQQLADFVQKYADLPTLGYTHFQPAQPTTVGKRAALWLQDLMMDFAELQARLDQMPFLGVKGATGTQSSFLALFDGDHEKVEKLEGLVAKEMGFSHLFKLSCQTYPRKWDMRILSLLSGIAASAHKCATDLRLLSHLKEIEEPFAEKQVGSSAMPYKRNPMLCERICGLARFLMSLAENPTYTAATQWLERSLDDSANRRLTLPEAFLSADALLNLLIKVTANLTVYPKMIEKHLREELPFLATENILMAAVKKGAGRQELHEKLRTYCQESARKIKEEGAPCDLLEKIASDPAFCLSQKEIAQIVNVKQFIGRAPEQVRAYLATEVAPLLKRYSTHQT
jgi:adenylosuccinate lyase